MTRCRAQRGAECADIGAHRLELENALRELVLKLPEGRIPQEIPAQNAYITDCAAGIVTEASVVTWGQRGGMRSGAAGGLGRRTRKAAELEASASNAGSFTQNMR